MLDASQSGASSTGGTPHIAEAGVPWPRLVPLCMKVVYVFGYGRASLPYPNTFSK